MNNIIEKIVHKAKTEINAITGKDVKVVVFGLERDSDLELYSNANNLVINCCNVWDVEVSALRSKSKKRMFTIPRQALAHILYSRYAGKIKLIKMATLIGQEDHSDFLHAYKRAKDLLSVNDEILLEKMNQINHLLR